MTRHNHELTEACALVRDLQHIELRNDGDRCFLESWGHYLDRTGDGDAARRVGGRRRQRMKKERSFGSLKLHN